MGSALGTLVGGGLGFLVGGPAGAAIGAGIGGGVGGGIDASRAAEQQAGAAREAAGTYAASADRAAEVQREMFERQVALQEPWRKAGQQALNQLVPLATQYTPFGTTQFQQDPGYAFRLAEGQKALDRQAAARGGLISGSALKATQRYGQEMGSQEYQNAFNRYQTEQQARLNPLQSLAGVGQTSVNQLGSAGQQYASNIGNIGMGAGAAQGNALLAGAQARGSAYQGVGQQIGNFMGQPGMQNYLGGLNQYAPTFGYSGQ